ncbi:MAG: LacI family DNA-binding transcriptional regulator [Eubacteriales bacterium]|nr:LacI family DNA-binding transcriptional regulator [Eubacteriales bacterium]
MATIKEVARQANVSVTTVSRVLNRRGYISEDMYEKVHNAMKTLDYQPNEIARSLIKRRSRLIGVLIPTITSTFFSQVVDELVRITTEMGYKIILYCSTNKADSAQGYVNMLKANQVDGIILGMHSREIERELDKNLPVVSFERYRIDAMPVIVCDNLSGGRMAAQELLDCGCRRPVMLGERRTELAPANDRFIGFEEIIRAQGQEPRIIDVLEQDTLGSNYSRSAAALFDLCPDADGVFCSSDHLASYVLQEAHRRGIQVPSDVKVVGFNDDLLAPMATPPLTSVHQPIREMCEAAMALLIRRIEGETIDNTALFPVQLVRRESTRGSSNKERS